MPFSHAAINGRELRIILPAHNESRRLDDTIAQLWEYFGTRATLLVVANGCTDDTVRVARRLARAYPTVELLDIPTRIGKGGAVRAGLTFGTEPYVAFVDADGSTAPDQLDIMLRICQERGLSGVIGSRWLPGSRIGRRQPFRRRLASRAFNYLVQVAFGLHLSDTQCGAKVFERSAIDEVLDRLEIANFAFDVDVLLSLRRIGKPVAEIPISWEDVAEYSKVRVLRSGPPMLWALLRLFIKESVFRQFPILDIVGRSETIPVRFGLDILFLSSRTHAENPFLTELIESLRARGHTARDVRLNDISSVLRFTVWYVRQGHILCNVIVDGLDKRPRLLSYSAKPKFRLEELKAQNETPEAFCERFVEEIVTTMNGSLHFRRNGDGWNLASQRLEASPRDR